MSIIALLLGIIVYVLLELNKAGVNPSFDWKTFFWKNIIGVAIVFFSILAVIILKNKIIESYPMINPYLNPVIYFIVSITGPNTIKRIAETVNSKIETKVGLNK